MLEIRKLTSRNKTKTKELKVIKQTFWFGHRKKINIFIKNVIDDEVINFLLDIFGKHTHCIRNWAKRYLKHKEPKKYSLEVRQFAVSIHFFSCQAYSYVRKQFNTVLPHTRTINKW